MITHGRFSGTGRAAAWVAADIVRIEDGRLAAACPNGIDVYFENVGGAFRQAVLPLLKDFARVPVCGLIAQYNAPGPGPGPNLLPATMREVLSKSLTLRGYIPAARAAAYYRAATAQDS